MRSLLVAVACVSVAMSACEPEKLDRFEVDLDVDGDGIVVSAPEGLACEGNAGDAGSDGACDAEFDEGTRLTLQARARAGFVFFGWDDDCAPESEGGDALPDGDGAPDIVDLVLTDDVDCSATFVPEELVVTDDSPSLSIVVVGPGSVAAAGGLETLTCGADERCATQFPEDAVVLLEATPESGAQLVGFSGDCEPDFQGASTGSVVMDRDKTCTVSFFAVGDVTYPLRVLIEGNGRVTSSPAGIDCDEVDADCEARFDHGTFVTVTASADAGWTFVEWGHTCQDVGFGPTLDVEMLFGLACSAVFERQLNVSVVGQGRVDSVGLDPPFACDAGTCTLAVVDEGIELVATADAGHRFVGWSGQCSGTSANVVVPDNASACTATFELIPPVLTVDIVGAGNVTSTDETIACTRDDGAAPPLAGTCSAEVSAQGPTIIDPGQWVCSLGFFGTGDGCDCGCGLPDPDCVSSAASMCDFASECGGEQFVVVDRNHLCFVDDGGGTPTVTLIATAADGFLFSSWQGPAGSGCTGTAATITVSIAESATCTAVFAQTIEVTPLRSSPRMPPGPFELAVSRDGARVAVVGDSGERVFVLDAATARPADKLNAGIAPVRMAILADDGGRYALSLADATIALHVIEGPGDFVTLTGHSNAVDELAYGPTFGNAIDFASGDDSGRVKLWSSTSGLVQRTLVPFATPVVGLAFVSDDIVVAVGRDGDVVTTTTAGVAVDALDVLPAGATGEASCLRLASSDGAVCVVAAFDGVHHVTISAAGDISEGALRPVGVAFDIDLVDTNTALLVRDDGSARVLDLASGATTTIVSAGAGAASIGAGGGATRAVIVDEDVQLFTGAARTHVLTSAAWTRAELLAGRRVVVGGGLDPIAFFDGAPGSALRSFAAPGNVTSLFPGAGSVFAATSAGSVVRIDADDGAQTVALSGLSPPATSFALNAAEDRVAVAANTFADDVVVYELPVGDPFRTLTGLFEVNDVVIAGDHLFAANQQRVTSSVIASGTALNDVSYATFGNSVALDARVNGSVVVAATLQGSFMALDAVTGGKLFELALACSIDDVAISFDDAIAAVSCADRIVLVDIALEAPRGEIVGPFRDVRFAPDENVLLAVDADGWHTFALSP